VLLVAAAVGCEAGDSGPADRRAATATDRASVSPAADTMPLAEFLRRACAGVYVCDLRLRRVTGARFQPPDTVVLTVEFSDPRGERYQWGPCCGGGGPPETEALMRAVARDSGFSVVTLPLYVP
jgi:hypothetical protein